MGCRFEIRALSAALFLAVTPGLAAAEGAQCRDDLAILRTGDQPVSFTVEIADSSAERAQGLMGRREMDEGAGMLFIYEHAREVAFWMHDTPLPLDMVFIDPTGEVVKVAANTTPNDDTPIPSGAPGRDVLEINAGMAARHGIAPGAQLAHPSVDPALAAFPCE